MADFVIIKEREKREEGEGLVRDFVCVINL